MLRTRYLPVEGNKSRKLSPRWIGPFRMKEIDGPLTYRLDIPPSFNISHPVYHVSNLERYHAPDVAQGRVTRDQPRVWCEKAMSPIKNSVTPYKILACRTTKGGRQAHYQVEFAETGHRIWVLKTFIGFAHSDDKIIDDFHTLNPNSPRPTDYIPENEDYTQRRCRPKVQFTRESTYGILADRPYGDKVLQYSVCNPVRPTTTL